MHTTTPVGSTESATRRTHFLRGRRRSVAVLGCAALSTCAAWAQGYDISPSQLLTAYGFNTVQKTYSGAGQTIAIYTASYYPNLQSDVDAFSKAYMSGTSTTVNVIAEGGSTTATRNAELALDVEYAHLLAPKATIEVYNGGGLSSDAILATKSGASVYTTSYTSYESDETASLISTGNANYNSAQNYKLSTGTYNKMVSFSAAGDTGHVDYPASSPYVIGVEGTDLYTNSSGVRTSEISWSTAGGGQSTQTEPAYQYSAQSSGFRESPDVSVAGGSASSMPVYVNGAISSEYGSSIASPIWAGYMALIQEARTDAGKSKLSTTDVLNLLYASMTNGQYSTIFHDITSSPSGSDNTAGVGYDEATGLGVPNGAALANYLITAPEPGACGVLACGMMMLGRRRSRKR